MLYDDEYIAHAIKGDYAGDKKLKVNPADKMLIYILKTGMIVAFGIIFVICYIPILSSLYEIFARTYSRGAVGFFLRGAYYKTKLKKMGKNVFIDVGVTIWCPKNVEIGNDSHIDTYVTILGGSKGHGSVKIGKYVHVASFCVLSGRGNIEIGDYAMIAAGSKIYSGTNYYKNPDNNVSKLISMSSSAPLELQYVIEKPIKIEEYAFVGLNAIVLPGVTIGKAAVIGSASMVSQSIAPFSIAVGIPAKVIKCRTIPYNLQILDTIL